MHPFLLATLFFFLSPGMVVTIPKGTKGYFFSCQTSVTAGIVHALVFVLAYTILRGFLHGYEGFGCGCQQEQPACGCTPPCAKPKPTCKPPKPKRCCKGRSWYEWLFGDSSKIYSV